MNAFVNAVKRTSTVTRTENGDLTYSSSLNAAVDMFFQIGAIRTAKAERIHAIFAAAYEQDAELAVRIALYGRDVRGGAGERRVFREIIQYMAVYHAGHLRRILHLIPVVGRWDDLVVLFDFGQIGNEAVNLFAQAILARNALAAKWAPREKQNRKAAARLASALQTDWRAYRKMLSEHYTIEQDMCAKNWSNITYSHVPSVASARYAKAFGRNDNSRYVEYLNAVRDGKVDEATGKVAKINTGAVYPYDVLKQGVSDVTADTMWANLPDYVPAGLSFLPLIDVSGSMGSSVGSVSAMDVAVSLGMYLAERNKSAFKDMALTFESQPKLFQIPGGTVRRKQQFIMRQPWGGSTNLDAAMEAIINHALAFRVPREDMPKTLIVLSDMEFNPFYGYSSKGAAHRTLDKFRQAGYDVPNIVWWNIMSRHGNTPVRAGENGMALVSGFSPAIVSTLLGGQFTPEKIMLKAVMIDKYDH